MFKVKVVCLKDLLPVLAMGKVQLDMRIYAHTHCHSPVSGGRGVWVVSHRKPSIAWSCFNGEGEQLSLLGLEESNAGSES